MSFHVNVESIDAAIERLTMHGGTGLMGSREVPGGSWIAQATDPQGEPFALVAPRRRVPPAWFPSHDMNRRASCSVRRRKRSLQHLFSTNDRHSGQAVDEAAFLQSLYTWRNSGPTRNAQSCMRAVPIPGIGDATGCWSGGIVDSALEVTRASKT
jgi:hypothetical protein